MRASASASAGVSVKFDCDELTCTEIDNVEGARIGKAEAKMVDEASRRRDLIDTERIVFGDVLRFAMGNILAKVFSASRRVVWSSQTEGCKMGE